MNAYKSRIYSFVCLLGLIIFSQKIQAQDDTSSQDISYGPQIKVGVNSWIGAESSEIDLRGMSLFGAGGFFKYSILDFLAVRAEIGYLLSGANNLEAGVSVFEFPNQRSQTSSIRVQSLESVLLADLKLPFSDNLPRILVGASFNYIFYANSTNDYLLTTSDNFVYSISTRTNATDKFRKTEVAGNIGLAYDINVAGFNTTLDARYRVGITPITTYPFRSPTAKEVYRNSVFLTLSVTL